MSWRPGIDLLNTKWPDSNDQQADRTRNPARTMRSAPQPSSFTGWGSHCVNDFFPPDFINPITPTHGLSQQPQGPYRRGNLFSHEIVPEYYSTGVNDDMNQQLMSSGDSLVDGIPTSNGVSLDNSMGPGTIENHARRNNQGRPISSPRGKTRYVHCISIPDEALQLETNLNSVSVTRMES